MKKLLAILMTLSLLLCAFSALAEATAAVPSELVGEWTGVGTPKNGGPAIDLTATINADGSGEYTFDQGGYHESYPFTISSDDSAFSVDIPADNLLGISGCGGTWALEDGVLKLDITTTFANGGSYSYTAECGKAEAEAEADSVADASDLAGFQPVVPNIQPVVPNIQPVVPNIQPVVPNIQPVVPNIQPVVPNIQPVQPSFPTASGTGGEDQAGDGVVDAPAWAGREWQLDTIHFKTLSENSPYSIDGGLSLNGGSTYGNYLLLADNTVYTDIDLNGLIEAVPQLPFSVPELDLTAYDEYTLDGDTLRLAPGDIEMTVGDETDALSLTYVTHVDIRSQTMDNGLTTQAGETDLEVIMGFVPMGTAAETAEEAVEEPAEEPAEEPSSVEIGDTVTFGRYEQDGDDANGPEPIEWLVLDTEDAVATLISRYGLDAMPFTESDYNYGFADWRYCSLREWLNGDFLSTAFAADEQARIETSVVTENGVFSAPTDDEVATCDQVYLLSAEEARRYFSSDSARQCEPTQFAINRGARISELGTGTCYWWLRLFENNQIASGVSAMNGKVYDHLYTAVGDDYAVRPVIRLRLENMPGTAKGKAEAEPSILPGMAREEGSSSGYDTAQHLAERYGVAITDGRPLYSPSHPQPLNAYVVTHADCDVGINGDDMYKVREKGLVDSITRYLKEWIGEIEEESGRTIRFVEDPDSADVLICACQTYKFYGTYGQGTYTCSAYSSTVTLEAIQLSHPENRTRFSLTQNPGNTITTNGGSKNWRLPPELENTPEMAVFVDTILSWYGWGLKPGTQGEGVAALQQALVDRGCLTGEASGSYDAQTEDAVKALQTACGLNPTGRVDAATLIAVYYGQEEVDALPEEVRAAEPEFEYGGEVVHCPDSPADFEFQLFTNDIRGLTNGFLTLPAFANGCEMVVRLTPVNGSITHDEIMAIQDSFMLRSPSGAEVAPYAIITGAEAGSEAPIEAFDIVYHSEEWAPLESWDFLCDGVLYSLAGLPEDGEPLQPMPTATPTPEPTVEPTATPVPESIVGLNALYDRARKFLGSTDPLEIYGKDTIVAIYYYDYIGTWQEPEVLTADAGNVYGFPREYLADSWDSAKRAAIIYPDIEGAGSYSNGYPASSTTTFIVLFDLEGDRQSERIEVAFNDPPQYYTNDGKGKFEYQKALTLLASNIEAGLANPTPEVTPEPAEEPAGEVDIDDMLAALNNDTYRATYDALLSGEVVQKGSKGDAARGVQQTLVAFGQSISVDGNVGPKSIAALNAVQASFGLPETESLDAEGYAALLPRLLMVTNPDEADALLAERMDASEYDYMRACALVAQGKYASAKSLFEECGWGDWEARAGACVQPWPKTGVLYKNPNVKGSSTELAVQFNTDEDTAMLVKIYTADGVLARTMFIGGTGKAKTSLPAGTYIIKDGTGKNWYGEEEAFGSEGYYEIMTFGDDQQEVELKKNYSSTITVNVQEDNPDAEGVGSDWESWEDF